MGWEANPEVRGTTSDGEAWIADVLCERDGLRVAFEVQWSSQSDEEFRRRQQRYARSGVRTIWVTRGRKPMKHSFQSLSLLSDVPIFSVHENSGTYTLPQFDGARVGTLVQKALQGAVRRWPRRGARAHAQVFAGDFSCRCGATSRNLVRVRLEDRGAPTVARPAVDIDMDTAELFAGLVERLLPRQLRQEFPAIASRWAASVPTSFVNRSRSRQVVNVCGKCSGPLVTEPYWIGSTVGELVYECDTRVAPSLEARAWWFVDGKRVPNQLPPTHPRPYQQDHVSGPVTERGR